MTKCLPVRLVPALGATLLAVVLPGCGGGTNTLGSLTNGNTGSNNNTGGIAPNQGTGGATPITGGAPTTEARGVDALTGDGANRITFRLGNTLLGGGSFAFANGTNYTNVNSGTKISATASESTASQPLVQQSVNVVSNTAYTLVAAGQVGTAGTTAPRLLAFTDAFATLPANMAGLRVINAAVGTPALSVANSVGFSVVSILGLSGIAYGSASDYVPLSTGRSYNLSIRDNAGNVVSLPFTAAANLSNLQLQAQHNYTLFLIGTPGATVFDPGTFTAELATDN